MKVSQKKLQYIWARRRGLLKLTRFLSASAFLLVFFQNCFSSQMIENSSLASLSEIQIPITHPPEEKVLPPTQKLQLVNRVYIESLFRDIFKDLNGNEVPGLDALLHNWIVNRGTQLGYSCDVYSSYSGRDCASRLTEASVYTNATGGVRAQDNVLRQSYIVKLCEGVLEQDQAVDIILSKIRKNKTDEATALDIGRIWDLFYRGDYIDNLSLRSLIDFDREMKRQGEAPFERWRALMVLVCESPGWQVL